MIQIRENVFETNSSSTHTICICTAKQYADFTIGRLYYDENNDCLLTTEQAIEKFNELKHRCADDADVTFEDFGILSWEQWADSHQGLESYHEEFTTPSGDNMVAFGKYGEEW